MSQKIKNQIKKQLARDERGSLALPNPTLHMPNLHEIFTVELTYLNKFLAKIKSVKPEHYIIGAAVFSQLLVGAYLVNFLLPKNVNFSYASNSCFNNLVLFPKLHSTGSVNSHTIDVKDSLKIAGYPVASTSVCITPVDAPEVGSTSLKFSPALLPFLGQKITVQTPELPAVANVDKIEKMPTNIPAVFTLDVTDKTFDYKLAANELTASCRASETEISCDTKELKLKQSTKYNFKLQRYFSGALVGTVFEKNISTIEAITVKSTSVKNKQIIYDKTKEFSVEFSKTLSSHDGVTLTNATTGKAVPISVTMKDKSLTIMAKNDLPRLTEFELSIAQVTAPDLSSLTGKYTLNFSTSGGPKVLSVSASSYGVNTTSNISLNFDSPVASSNNVSNYVTLSTANGKVGAAVYVNGSTVTIDPASNLPRCTAFTVRVLDGISSVYGITGGSAWTYNSRTICRTESVIGSSVLGRSIVAYHFGNGPSKIIFFGNMHGNEASGKYTLDSFVNDLEARFDQIPANRTIIVIPTINPDGLVAGNRYNSRQVDLNRNFPDVDWQSEVLVAGGQILANNGGSAPLSEPESAAIANFILSQSPRLILSYHAVASVVIANEAGDSTALANTYANLSNYWAPSAAQSGGLFDYQITGTMEGWAYNILGIPTLVIEQSTYYGNEFYSNRNAMWAMANLP